MLRPVWTALIVLWTVLAAAPVTAANAGSACRLEIGWEEWFPFIYKQDGQFAGLEYQLLQQLALRADCQLVFVEVPWGRSLRMLQNQELDVLSAASQTPERLRYARFSLPYRMEQLVLVTRAASGNPTSVSLEQWLATPNMQGNEKIIGLVLANYYGEALESLVRDPALKSRRIEVRRSHQLRQMLVKNRIDGFLVERSVALAGQEQPEVALQLVNLSENKAEPLHLMFSLGVPVPVVERFNAAIRASAAAVLDTP